MLGIGSQSQWLGCVWGAVCAPEAGGVAVLATQERRQWCACALCAHRALQVSVAEVAVLLVEVMHGQAVVSAVQAWHEYTVLMCCGVL